MAEGDEPDESQKTEDPTPKKLSDARNKGQVALSREINNWMVLLAGTLVILAVSPFMVQEMHHFLSVFMERPHDFIADNGGLGLILKESFSKTLLILALPFAIFMFFGFIGPFLQVGPLFAPAVLEPKLDKISIQKGFKRLFSMRAVVEFLKGIVKLVIVGVVATVAVYPFFGTIAHMIDLPMDMVMAEILALEMRVLISILVVLLIVAVLDYTYQKSDHHKKMRMTKQEVKDEYKTTEGDPQVKAKLRQLRQQKASQRMMAAVPTADVVIMNPTHYAVALKYEPAEHEAPVCVAKGINETALRIRDLAKEHGVVIEQNAPLARALYGAMEIDDPIPYEHFQAVAKIISYVFQKKKKNL